jgi:hypothetical protein
MTLRKSTRQSSERMLGSRKRKRLKGGSGKYAKVFLVNIRPASSNSRSGSAPCWPADKSGNKEQCIDPEWIYTSGKRTNKIQCLTEKQKQAKEDKKDDGFLDVFQTLVDTIISKGGKEGDLVENVAESGYRTEGVYILKMNKKKKKLAVSPLDGDYDPYGHVGADFSLGPDFPVGYWTFAFDRGTHVSITEKGSFTSIAHWHNDEEQAEPVSQKIIKSIKKTKIVEKKGVSEVEFPWGTLRFPTPKDETWANMKTLKYRNGRIYFEPSAKEPGVATLAD